MPHVLIVDSDDDSREMYSEWLLWRGISTTSVPTASAALDAMQQSVPPDAVIACLRLSDTDPFGLFHAIRVLPRGDRIPIIALSTCMPDHDRAADDSHVDVVLMKPCLPTVLHDSLLETLNPGLHVAV